MRTGFEMQALKRSVEVIDDARVIAVDVDGRIRRLHFQPNRAALVSPVRRRRGRVDRRESVPRVVRAVVAAVESIVNPEPAAVDVPPGIEAADRDRTAAAAGL